MDFDLVLRDVRPVDFKADQPSTDIGVKDGRIAAIAPKLGGSAREEVRGHGRLVCSGFVDTHIHLDKACILGRCNCREGTLAEAIAETAAAKRGFTEADVYERAQRTMEKAILQGTTRMRTHVEVDPRIGLTSFRAIQKLKADYAFAIDLQICVFPQEGLLNDPGTDELLVAACEQGADLIGGCPYTDSDRSGQISRIFDLAREYDLDIDFHLDFDLKPEQMDLDEICEQTSRRKWGGRVAIGHVTKLSAVDAETLATKARMLADAGVAVTVLPATDLFLMGRGHDHNVPRGVTLAHKLLGHGVNCSLATNNVLNPFTPFGDCSLPRIANLYANIAQVGTRETIASCFEMITHRPAKLMNLGNYGIRIGNPADFVILDSDSILGAVAEISQPVAGFKNGVKTFTHAVPQLHAPK